MTPSTKPPYVPRHGQQDFLQPIALEAVRFSGFMLRADSGALKTMCDRYLTGPTGGGLEYRPLAPVVMLGFAEIQRAHSVPPPDSNMGSMLEIDVAFWVPVARIKREAGVALIERVNWFLPYVFVNNAWALASGRESYGFPKALGEFVLPASPADPARFGLSTLVLDPFGPTSPPTMKPLAEVVRSDAGPHGQLESHWTEAREGLKDLFEVLGGINGRLTLPGLGLIAELRDLITHEEFPLVFLKQFRDVADGTRACYQAIVEAQARVTGFRSGGRLAGPYQVTLNSYDSHPLLQDFGFSGPVLKPLMAWRADFDFVMENGQELWRAG